MILISAFNLYKGGSLELFKSLLDPISVRSDITLVVSKNMGHLFINYKKFLGKKISFIYPLKFFNSPYRLFLEQLLIPLICIFCRPKTLIMMGNFPSLFWFGKQNVLFHNSLYLDNDFKLSSQLSLEVIIFKTLILLKKPTILVQTGLMRDKINDLFHNKITVQIIGSSGLNLKFNRVNKRRNTPLVLIYPAAFYPHKNHKILMGIDNFLSERNIKIILTISKDQFESLNACDLPAMNNIDCVGSISHKMVLDYLENVDAMLFLSKVESLGMPLLEAVQCGLPIIAPDLPYVKYAINGYYDFDCNSLPSLLKSIDRLRLDLANEAAICPKTELLSTPEEYLHKLIS